MRGSGARGSASRQTRGVSWRLANRSLDVKAGPAITAGCVALFFILMIVGTVAGATGVSQGQPSAGMSCKMAGGGESPPAKLLPIYQRAAEKYKLGPRAPAILASINFHETTFGTNTNNTTGSGAMGWMMFMPETWAAYGVDANGDGVKDPHHPEDAIFAAANYLKASGAPGDWPKAIFAYNHADWYVEDILATAEKYSGAVVCTAVATGPLGELPSDRLERIEYVARWIESKRLHYCWGGGHAPSPGPSGGDYCWNGREEKIYGAPEKGLDCSGAVRWLLVLTGYPDPGPIVSGSFSSAYPSGPGRYVTIWSNAAHVFITINGRDWGTASANFAHGPAFGDQSPSGFVASHPPGL